MCTNNFPLWAHTLHIPILVPFLVFLSHSMHHITTPILSMDCVHQVLESGNMAYFRKGQHRGRYDFKRKFRKRGRHGVGKWRVWHGLLQIRPKVNKRSIAPLNEFDKDDYEGEWFLMGRFMSTMTTDASWAMEGTSRLWKKAYKFFLQGGKIWLHP